jgi:hypothetical protein
LQYVSNIPHTVRGYQASIPCRLNQSWVYYLPIRSRTYSELALHNVLKLWAGFVAHPEEGGVAMWKFPPVEFRCGTFLVVGVVCSQADVPEAPQTGTDRISFHAGVAYRVFERDCRLIVMKMFTKYFDHPAASEMSLPPSLWTLVA